MSSKHFRTISWETLLQNQTKAVKTNTRSKAYFLSRGYEQTWKKGKGSKPIWISRLDVFVKGKPSNSGYEKCGNMIAVCQVTTFFHNVDESYRFNRCFHYRFKRCLHTCARSSVNFIEIIVLYIVAFLSSIYAYSCISCTLRLQMQLRLANCFVPALFCRALADQETLAWQRQCLGSVFFLSLSHLCLGTKRYYIRCRYIYIYIPLFKYKSWNEALDKSPHWSSMIILHLAPAFQKPSLSGQDAFTFDCILADGNQMKSWRIRLHHSEMG